MNLLSILLNIIAPETCVVCATEGAALCEACRHASVYPVLSVCYRCNAATSSFAVCGVCRPKTSIRQAWVVSTYEAAIKTMLWDFKYSRKRQLAPFFAKYLDEVLPYLPDDVLITYVPTAARRLRVRGYDHAKSIAKELAHIRGRSCTPLLYRYGSFRQVGASRDQRRKQAEHSYEVRNGSLLPGRSVLIVDDVMTSGSTLEACASALKRAGARTVYVAVIARDANQ